VVSSTEKARFVRNTGARPMILGVIVADLLVALLIAFALTRSYNQYEDRAATNVTNLARTIQQYLTATVERIDVGLADVAREAKLRMGRGPLDDLALDRFIDHHGAAMPAANATRIADADGDVLYGTCPAPCILAFNVAQSDYFIRHRDDSDAGLVVSAPFIGRGNGKWTLVLSRRIETPEGRFAGVAFSSVFLDSIAAFFASVDVGPNGGISLRDRDMAIVIRHPDPGGKMIGISTISPELRAFRERGDDSGTYYSGQTWDGTARVVSFARIGSYPLFITVGLAPTDFLGPWKREAALFAAFYLAFVVLSGTWAWQSHRRWRERIATETEARHTLERRVREATASLDAALRDAWVARDAALSASRAKSEFLANMSHELRTPLNAILGYTQLLTRDRTLAERQAARLGTVEQAALHLLTLIDDLLDLAKIEARRFDLSPGPLAPAAFLEGIADIVRVKADEKGLRFAVDLSPDLPPRVRADDARLRQILLNLLGNAIKFTDHGTVTFRAWSEGAGADGARIAFEVADTGIGMSGDEQGRLFQPFERVGEARRRTPGTGLGLAISRELARLMGGDIRVESRPGTGSRFRLDLVLPLADDEADARPAERDIVGYAGRRRAVLIVDDIATNRRLLADMLGELGFAVAEAADGNAAQAHIATAPPDLVLMDVVMPNADGVGTIRALRKRPDLDTMPILAVSANATPEEKRQALAAGADAFVAKPIERRVLLTEIGGALRLEWVYAGDLGGV
jgi:signal transduction histidine kinase/CheY-like chemotaxis protein